MSVLVKILPRDGTTCYLILEAGQYLRVKELRLRPQERHLRMQEWRLRMQEWHLRMQEWQAAQKDYFSVYEKQVLRATDWILPTKERFARCTFLNLLDSFCLNS